MIRRTLSACLALSLVLVGVLFNAASTRAAGPVVSPPKQYYLALGDSISFGYQEAKFQALLAATGTSDPNAFNTGWVDRFSRSLRSINPAIQTVNMSCPGETTTTFINGGCVYGSKFALHYAYTGSQLSAAVAFLTAHPGQVSPITLLMGANDILQLVDKCGGLQNLACVSAGLPDVLKTLQTNLAQITGALRAAAPDAQIIVISPYNPFAAVDPATNALATPLRTQLYPGVASAFGAQYVDLFVPFNVPQPQPQNICFLTLMCPARDIHPSDVGHILIAQTVLQGSGYLSIGAGVPLSAVLYGSKAYGSHAGAYRQD